VNLAAEDENHSDSDFDFGGLEEGLGSERDRRLGWRVSATRLADEGRRGRASEGDLAAEEVVMGRFRCGSEGVGVEEERDRKGD